jgi:anti-sigma B factor antagonist
MSTAPPVLDVDVAHVDAACVIRLQGELDIATAPMLEDSLRSVLGRNPSSITLDLDSVGFIDSMGLRALLAAAQRSRENGDRLRIRCGAGAVRRLIEVAGAERALPLVA